MYHSILVPLDGSKRAEAILPHAEDLAQRYQAKVIFLGVVEPGAPALSLEPMYSGFALKHYEECARAVEHYLATRQGEFREKGIVAKIEVGHGPVVESIINTAEQQEVDLIAMASHGRTGLARAFYGSVAAGVLHRVDRPLLLIRSLDQG